MDVCMYVCMDGCMDKWMYGCMDVWMYGRMDVWMYGCVDVRLKQACGCPSRAHLCAVCVARWPILRD